MRFGLTRPSNHILHGSRDFRRKGAIFVNCPAHWKAFGISAAVYVCSERDHSIPNSGMICDAAYRQNALTTCYQCYQSPVHCLNSLLPLKKKTDYKLRNRHCSYTLPQCNYNAFKHSFVNWCLFTLQLSFLRLCNLVCLCNHVLLSWHCISFIALFSCTFVAWSLIKYQYQYIHGPWRAKKNFCCFICVSYEPYPLLQNDSFFYIYNK